MAYMSQETKAKLVPAIKAVCKKYGVKASVAVRNHSTLCLNINSGKINFFESYNRQMESICSGTNIHPHIPEHKHIHVNEYYYDRHFDGTAVEFLQEVIPLMYGPDYYDHSDAQTDYFNCSHYIDVNVGRWNKPYELTA